MRITVNKDHLIRKTALFLFFIVFFLYYVKILPFAFCNLLYIVETFFLGLLLIKDQKNINAVWVVLISILFLGFLTGSHTNDLNLTIYFKSVCYVLLGYYLIRDGLGVVYANILFVIVEIILLYGEFVSKVPGNLFFTSLSRNYFSVFSLIVTILVYYEQQRAGEGIRLHPAIINFLICVGSVGRGGIISGAILLLGVIFLKYFLHAKTKIKFLFMITFIFIVIALLFAPEVLSQYAKLFERFQSMGLGSAARGQIWMIYLHDLFNSLFNVLFGVKIEGVQAIEAFQRNLHNTFLQMHYTYGLIFCLMMVCYTVKSGIKMIKEKSYLMILLLITFLIRANIDQLGYAFYSEVFIYFFAFYSLGNWFSLKRIDER